MSVDLVDKAAKALEFRLQPFRKFPMTASLMGSINGVIKEHYDECVARSIPFPRCVAVMLPPPFNWLHVVRAECTHAEIQALARQMIDQFPGLRGPVLANAVRRAFPDYRPDLIINNKRTINMKGEER